MGEPTRRRLPWQAIAWIAFLACIGLFLYGLPALANGDWGRLATSFGQHLWLIGWLLLVSFMVRTRNFRNVTAALFGGYFTAMWLARTVGAMFGDWLGMDNVWRLVIAVPALEEVVKAIPLVMLVLVSRFRRWGSPSVCDFVVVGVAAGAGFAIHEDALWGRISGGGFDSALGWLLPTVHTETGIAAGHAVWTGLLGLAVGFWFVNRHRRWTLLIPLAGLTLVILDHGWWNDVIVSDQYRRYLLDGWLVVGLFLVGLVGVAALEIGWVAKHVDDAWWRLKILNPIRIARGPITWLRTTTWIKIANLHLFGARWLMASEGRERSEEEVSA